MAAHPGATPAVRLARLPARQRVLLALAVVVNGLMTLVAIRGGFDDVPGVQATSPERVAVEAG